jgi:hypothetical protein
MSDLELLADTMEEWSTTSGDHHMLAAAAIRQLIKLQAALQSGEPVAAVKGWFHGECTIQPLDLALVMPAGMALYATPQPVVPERLESLLHTVQGALYAAYQNADLVCCGKFMMDCCGSQVSEWSEADQKIMDVLSPIQRELFDLLSAGKGGEQP